MKTKELKTIIKKMVRECIHELLAEKYIENTISEMTGFKKRPMQEQVQASVQREPKTKPLVPEMSKRELAAKYGFDENDPMASIYEDTMKNNSYINGTADLDPPGAVSERILEKSGIMAKDWSKYF